MKKLLFLTILSLGFFNLTANAQCEAVNQCAYTFIMTDSYGDGWTGATMTISQNGNDIAILGDGFTDGFQSTSVNPSPRIAISFPF